MEQGIGRYPSSSVVVKVYFFPIQGAVESGFPAEIRI